MEIINRTPHSIYLLGRDGATRVIEKTGAPTRIETESGEEVGLALSVPIFTPSRMVRITNLPAPRPDTVFVVSQIAAHAIAALYPDRTDIVYPGSGTENPRSGKGSWRVATRLIRAA